MKQLKWTTVVYCVDVDTGEILTVTDIRQYDYIQTIKKYTIDANKQTGTAELTKEYRTTKQYSLF